MIIAITLPSFSQNDSILDSSLEELLSNDSTITQASITNLADPSNTLFRGAGDLLLTDFNQSEINLKKGEIISNVLKVYNNSSEVIEFNLDIVFPGSWIQLTDKEKTYSASPRDTLFIPVILIPNKLINGNTEVIINAFLIDTDDQQIGNNFFSLKTKKSISWNVSVEPDNKFYFKNNENIKEFNYRIENTGNYKQDIFVSYKTLKGDLVLLDTNENIIKTPNLTLSLNSREDTTLTYKVSSITDQERNRRKISLYSYLPNTNLYYKKYSLFINSSDPKSIETNSFKKGNKVDFVKLPNETKADEYAYPYLPLTVEANIQNILDGNSFMALSMRGFKKLNEKASLAYFTQINYSQNYLGNNFIKSAPWYVGYFDDNKTIEIGQITGNVVGITGFGKGIKASYSYLEKHKTGLFYVKSPGLFGPRRNESFGLFHKYIHNRSMSVTVKSGRQINIYNNTNINSFSIQPSFNIQRKHFFNFIGALTRRNSSDTTILKKPATGYLVGGNYSSQFFDKRLKVNIGSRYNDKNFGAGAYKRLMINHRTGYDLKSNWNVYLANTYQNINTINSVTNTSFFKQEILSNSLVFTNHTKKGSYQPGAFFDYRDFLSNRIQNRGLSFRYSTFNFLQNFLISSYVKAGYSYSADDIEAKNLFSLQFSSLLRYQVWSFTTRYNYGSFFSSLSQNFLNNTVTPQTVRLSLMNQHQFKNRHLILESSIIYNYGNIFKNHTIGIYPELFFFTNDGWRFSLNSNYSFNTSDYGSVTTNEAIVVNGDFTESKRQYSDNITIGVSIKKDFGIPIPFIKHKSASMDFVSFYDINGNGKKEKEEPAIENVVIRLENKEVISNKDGKAAINNIPVGAYMFNVFALEELNGWFSDVDDSLLVFGSGTNYIPFVRGVKVYGDVVLDRQKIAITDISKQFDLSRIMVTATNGKTYNTLTDINGRYEFYMPNGDYVITMDEGILGNKYKLTRNNIPITLKSSQDGVYVSFYIVENRKKVVIKEFGNQSIQKEE